MVASDTQVRDDAIGLLASAEVGKLHRGTKGQRVGPLSFEVVWSCRSAPRDKVDGKLFMEREGQIPCSAVSVLPAAVPTVRTARRLPRRPSPPALRLSCTGVTFLT
jgi:hypothetical protein